MHWGVDISRYDDLTDAQWQAMVNNGVSFAIIRACHGAGYTDPFLQRHIAQANKYGIPFGLYQWVDITQDVQKQIDYFLHLIEQYPPQCVAGDFEQYWTDWDAWNQARLGGGGDVPTMAPDQINAIDYEYFTKMRAALSIPLISYTGAWFVNKYCPQMSAWLSQSYLWLAGYISSPTEAVGWEDFLKIVGDLGTPVFPTGIDRWDVWQFSASIPITGLPNLDLDAIAFEGVYNNLFILPKPYEPPAGGTIGKARVIAQNGLRVRAAPDLQAQILRTMPYGTLIDVVEIQNGWAHLVDGGWCAAQWLQLLDDTAEPPLPDTTAPAVIIDLVAAAGLATGSIDLAWTAPGDDARSGAASSYLVRCSASAINSQAAWDAATPVTVGVPTPQPAGQVEQMTVNGLTPGTAYYFAVRALDEAANLSGLSNSPSAIAKTPPPDTTAPAAILDLTAVQGAATGSVDLSWVAPGDDAGIGTATSYLVRYSTNQINSQARWESATPVTVGVLPPKPAGQTERLTVSVLTPGVVYYFAVRAQDEVSNLSALSNSPSAIAKMPEVVLPCVARVTAGAGLRVRATPDLQAQILRVMSYGAQIVVVEIREGWAQLADGGWCAQQWLQLLPDVPVPQEDITAPAAIMDLTAETGTAPGCVDISWTAPGDDIHVGTVASYLVRYSMSAINSPAGWEAATPVTIGVPAPKPAGQSERMTVSGLTPGTLYYFAVRAQDEIPNLGGLSNSPSAIAKTASLSQPRKARVTAGAGLRVRAAPDLQAQILRTMPYGTQVEVVEIRGDWACLSGGGWSAAQWLELLPETSEPPVTPSATQQARVTVKIGLRVRAAPNLQAQILRALPFDTVVEIVEIKDGWARLVDGGWCAAQWLEILE